MGNRKGKPTHGVKGKSKHGGTNPKSSSGKHQIYTKFLDNSTEKKSNSTEKKSNISSERDSERNQQNSTVDQRKLLSVLYENPSMLRNINQKALKEQLQKREKEQLQKRKKEQLQKLEQEQLLKLKKEQEQALEQARKRKQEQEQALEQLLKLKKEQEQALEQARKRKQEQALNNLNIEFTSLNEDVHEINLQVDVIQKYLPTKASNESYGFILTNGKISIEQLIEIIKNNAPLQQQDSSTSKGISIKSLYIIEKKNNNSHCTFRQKIVDQFTTNTENYDKDNMNVYLYIYDNNVATER